MFHFQPFDRAVVSRFEPPNYSDLTEVRLTDLSDGPFNDPNWQPGSCVLPGKYRHFADRIRNLEVFEDDVWVVSFPKSGSHWTQEMVWLINHNLDYDAAKATANEYRTHALEVGGLARDLDDTVSTVERLPRPRHIKSHLPPALLPRRIWTVKPKIFYVARNPKDVVTSYEPHYRFLLGFSGSQQDFLDAALTDRLLYSPQIPHVVEFWRLAAIREHILFLHYEDMKRNLLEVIQQVCQFLGKTYTPEQLHELEKYLSFDVMKENPSANCESVVQYASKKVNVDPNFRFMRKGQIGSYKEELPQTFIVQFDAFVEQQLKETGFVFKE